MPRKRNAQRSRDAAARCGPAIVWLRQDLRLDDNPALQAAIARGAPAAPLFILCDEEEGEWPYGGASRWWLHRSLAALAVDLRKCGSRLTLMRGPALAALQRAISQLDATAVYWNRRYEPASVARDAQVRDALRARGVDAVSFNGALLREPSSVQNQSGKPYRVYTPFKRNLIAQLSVDTPSSAPRSLRAPRTWPTSVRLDALALAPAHEWSLTLAKRWTPGEAGARARLKKFLAKPLADYGAARERPAIEGTSALSPHLHFGEVSIRRVWCSAAAAAKRQGMNDVQWRASVFASELLWREFAHHLLYHYPQTATAPLDRRFERFAWTRSTAHLRAWSRGMTGYPIIDAGMRQLRTTGWMHNRVRMIVASFLVKNLRIHWLDGARWFWDTLLDADLAANTLNWQWAAGSGADAAPYFRVFNPVTQGAKFDPDGAYVRRFVPALAKLPSKHIHTPWLAPLQALAEAGVRMGKEYPAPIVKLKASREAALAAYRRMRAGLEPS